MPNFEDHLEFLTLLVKATPRQRNALIKTSSTDQRLAITEIIYNFLHGTFSVSEELTSKLSNHKSIFRKLSKKKFKNNVSLFCRNILIIKLFLVPALKFLTSPP